MKNKKKITTYGSRGARATVMLDGGGGSSRLSIGIGLLVKYGSRKLLYVQVAVSLEMTLSSLLLENYFTSRAKYFVVHL